jgi:hypothetical protein
MALDLHCFANYMTLIKATTPQYDAQDNPEGESTPWQTMLGPIFVAAPCHLFITQCSIWLSPIAEDLPHGHPKRPNVTFLTPSLVTDDLWWHPAYGQKVQHCTATLSATLMSQAVI